LRFTKGLVYSGLRRSACNPLFAMLVSPTLPKGVASFLQSANFPEPRGDRAIVLEVRVDNGQLLTEAQDIGQWKLDKSVLLSVFESLDSCARGIVDMPPSLLQPLPYHVPSSSCLRVTVYPQACARGVSHEDNSLVTIVASSSPGLEVLLNGQWTPVEHVTGSCVVLRGTDYYFVNDTEKADTHRVMQIATDKSRVNVAFFLRGDPELFGAQSMHDELMIHNKTQDCGWAKCPLAVLALCMAYVGVYDTVNCAVSKK
jgi:hypothetical protein